MNHVAIVDYGMCNIDSVVRAIEECGGHPRVVQEAGGLTGVDRLILPGVGVFSEAMARLRERRLDEAIHEVAVEHGRPVLGICLGMQLLASCGTESEPCDGLGLVPGEVRRLRSTEGERIPHVGWNEVRPEDDAVLFRDLPEHPDFYFVHSYAFRCSEGDVAATTPYCGSFVSAVQRGNIYGVQFHPEKSQRHGFQVLHNFLAV